MMQIVNGIIEKTDKGFDSLCIDEQTDGVRITEDIENIVRGCFDKKIFVEESEELIYEVLLDEYLPDILNALREKRNKSMELIFSVRGETERQKVYESIKDMVLLSDLIEDYFQLKLQNISCVLIKL